MISIAHINFVNKLNFDVFIKNVISSDLFGSYGNIQLYSLWDRAQRINTDSYISRFFSVALQQQKIPSTTLI